MKTKIRPNIFISVGMLFALTGLVAADKPQPTIITFDAPGAVNGTEVAGNNPGGLIAGSYIDMNNVFHGYVRAKDGTSTTFDAQGSTFTIPEGINPAGVIAGDYADASFVFHGFVRAKDG